ncbi:MAG: hypothetical protein KF906_03580 [Actinobacteria bacterium]|nr:hypothetical protein [Actinomycetota bacterium]
MRVGAKRIVGAGLIAGALGLLAVVGVGDAGAQEGPTLTVTPTRGTAGDLITFTYTDDACDAPTFETFDSERLRVDVEATMVVAGVWEVVDVDPGADVSLTAWCGDSNVWITYDSDVPEFYLFPASSGPPMGTLRGTECDMPTATIVVVDSSGESFAEEVSVDENGSFQHPGEIYPRLLDRAEATCGDFVYDTIEFGGSVPPTTTTSTTSTTSTTGPAEPAAPAAAAAPVAAEAAYTG